MSRNFGIIVVVLSVMAAMAGRASAGTTLIDDTFDDAGTVGTGLTGRTPTPIDVPNSTYQTFLGQGGSIVSGQAVVGADSGVGLDVSAFNADPLMIVSGELSFNSAAFPAQGSALGFWPSFPSGGGVHGFTNFIGVGLGLDGSGGAILDLVSGFTTLDSISLGALNPATLHSLAYSVNRSTGAISGLSLDGTPYSFTTSLFTTTNTQVFGFGVHGNLAGDQGHFDDLELTVPEPASMGVLAVGSVALLGKRRRRM